MSTCLWPCLQGDKFFSKKLIGDIILVWITWIACKSDCMLKILLFYVPSCVVQHAQLIACMTDNRTAISFSGITMSTPAASSISDQ